MKNLIRLLVIVLISSMFMFSACSEDKDTDNPGGPNVDDLVAEFNLQTLPEIPYPKDNQYNPKRVELGRFLFYDPILSAEKRSTCGTCHHPEFAFADGRKLAIGPSESKIIGPGRTIGRSIFSKNAFHDVPRNSPTVFNTAYNLDSNGQINAKGIMFWDGRAKGLESQAVKPPTSRDEMRGDLWSPNNAIRFACNRIEDVPEYVKLFSEAFPEEAKEAAKKGEPIDITSDMLAKVLAAFERELVTTNSPYDRFVKGDKNALTDKQKRGLELFFTKAKCGSCHNGPMFSDFKFVVQGVPQIGPGKNLKKGDDFGREEFTNLLTGRYAFRTPTLRNVSLTAPYMHDGVLETLEDVVQFYNHASKPRHPMVTDNMLHPVLREPLGLTDDEVDAIVQFMHALEDNGSMLDPMLMTVPSSVPSGLEPLVGAKPVKNE